MAAKAIIIFCGLIHYQSDEICQTPCCYCVTGKFSYTFWMYKRAKAPQILGVFGALSLLILYIFGQFAVQFSVF
jgi:hypothetical protein